jgi:hypothetical protein
MRIDTLWKNIAGYVGWALLAVVIAILQEVHRQIINGGHFEGWLLLDAAILALLPVLIVMLGSMKQPSVGHEPLAAKADAHEDRLRVSDPVAAELPGDGSVAVSTVRVPAPGQRLPQAMRSAGAPTRPDPRTDPNVELRA